MKLKRAKVLRDRIRADGLHCTVPLGYGPGGYFCRIITTDGPKDFWTQVEYGEYCRQRDLRRLKDELLSRPRSPIDVLIDRAVGLEGTK